MRRLDLEIAVTSVAGAVTARLEGADRVELCAALELGGVTPSQGLVEASVATGIPVHALVRCRPGDFVYDADEIATMLREVRTIAASGVAGVVVGALDEHGGLHTAQIEQLADTARATAPKIEITVHRAIDRASDLVAAAASLAALGVARVLTSGGADAATAGAATLARMVAASGEVQVMAGGGVVPADIAGLASAGVDAVHLSAKRPAPVRPMPVGAAAREFVPMGARDAEAAEGVHFLTDAEVVAAARRAVDAQRHAVHTERRR